MNSRHWVNFYIGWCIAKIVCRSGFIFLGLHISIRLFQELKLVQNMMANEALSQGWDETHIGEYFRITGLFKLEGACWHRA